MKSSRNSDTYNPTSRDVLMYTAEARRDARVAIHWIAAHHSRMAAVCARDSARSGMQALGIRPGRTLNID